MPSEIEGMRIAASGHPEQVKRLGVALHGAKIPFTIAWLPTEETDDYSELWVEEEDIARARPVIQNARVGSALLLW